MLHFFFFAGNQRIAEILAKNMQSERGGFCSATVVHFMSTESQGSKPCFCCRRYRAGSVLWGLEGVGRGAVKSFFVHYVICRLTSSFSFSLLTSYNLSCFLKEIFFNLGNVFRRNWRNLRCHWTNTVQKNWRAPF